MRKTTLLLASLLLLAAGAARAQVGPILWQDDFNSLDNWLVVTGNGNWGWGNGELEYYSASNVSIADVPGEPGNKALRIIARNESGPGIVDAWGNPLNYTSGKVSSRSFVSVKYGMIETRVLVPDLRVGGWPAFWMLGTQTAEWPVCGEVDLMEMGAKQVFRNLHDTHNGGNGLDNSTENQMVGANAIHYSAGAVGPGNPLGVSSLADDPTDVYDRPYYSYANPLSARFLVYRMYWDDTSMRFTVVDGGVEHDLYEYPYTFGPDADAFRQPFYFLTNLAIGGAYTDAYVLGNPGAGVPISMPLPATMYVDYVRVYQWNGKGEVHLGPPTQAHGRFGVFTDTTPVQDALQTDVTSHVYPWEGTLVPGTIAPYEGANVISWKTNGKGWFGGGIMSVQPTNLFAMGESGEGTLKFHIKIPANVTFKIGIIDVWTNQNYVTFPANTTAYGLVRNGEWGEASIPVSELRGTLMDLRMLSYEFVILETNGASCEFAIDDIYWDSGVVAGVGEGAARAHVALLPGAPNPFRAGTALRFTLATAGAYELEVFDASGKRVNAFRGQGAAGETTVRWDGRAERGRAAPPGVYCCRLAAGDAHAVQRVVLLK